MTEASVRFTAGFLRWRDIRDGVAYVNHLGHEVRLWEGSGWISRDMEARGTPAGVRLVRDMIK